MSKSVKPFDYKTKQLNVDYKAMTNPDTRDKRIQAIAIKYFKGKYTPQEVFMQFKSNREGLLKQVQDEIQRRRAAIQANKETPSSQYATEEGE